MGRNPETAPGTSDAARQIAAGMLSMAEAFSPVFEAGLGLRTKLESEGWSPTMAEQIAGEFVLSTLRAAGRASS